MNKQLLKLRPKRFLCPFCENWHDYNPENFDEKSEDCKVEIINLERNWIQYSEEFLKEANVSKVLKCAFDERKKLYLAINGDYDIFLLGKVDGNRAFINKKIHCKNFYQSDKYPVVLKLIEGHRYLAFKYDDEEYFRVINNLDVFKDVEEKLNELDRLISITESKIKDFKDLEAFFN